MLDKTKSKRTRTTLETNWPFRGNSPTSLQLCELQFLVALVFLCATARRLRAPGCGERQRVRAIAPVVHQQWHEHSRLWQWRRRCSRPSQSQRGGRRQRPSKSSSLWFSYSSRTGAVLVLHVEWHVQSLVEQIQRESCGPVVAHALRRLITRERCGPRVHPFERIERRAQRGR